MTEPPLAAAGRAAGLDPAGAAPSAMQEVVSRSRRAACPRRATPRMAGLRVVVLSWRDVEHPQAGGAEQYLHHIARRWAAAGAEVSWLTARAPGQDRHGRLDGMDVVRVGGTFTVYAHVALRLLARRLAGHAGPAGPALDVVVDAQNGIPFFAPLVAPHATAVVQLVHHVHQDQFATRFPPPVAALGRWLERRVAPRVYRGRRIVAVSTSTRQEMRRRLRQRGVIDVVPNGTVLPRGAGARRRAGIPTVVLTTRLVPHKRVGLLLDAAAAARPSVPDLRVEVIGGGPELATLRARAAALGLDGVVRFHGRLPDAERDALVASAWLTTSTSQAEGWGCTVIEAAAWGVPCLALRVPGIRDSVVDGRTGLLVDDAAAFVEALPRALHALADAELADTVARACRRWAACFDWDLSAELFAGVVLSERESRRTGCRRAARSDMTTLARFTHDDPAAAAAALRSTDEISVDGRRVVATLHGCDELDAYDVVTRLGGRDVTVRLAGRHEVLGGPVGGPDDPEPDAVEDAGTAPSRAGSA